MRSWPFGLDKITVSPDTTLLTFAFKEAMIERFDAEIADMPMLKVHKERPEMQANTFIRARMILYV